MLSRFFGHAVWLVGFRPFFLLACLAALSLPGVWSLMLAGMVRVPPTPVSAVQWHAHEMIFGFGWAVLGGFLLTASKNWVGVRGWHGPALAFLALAWGFERFGMWFGGAWPHGLFVLSSTVFLASIGVMIAATLIRHRRSDTYRDNALFLVVLPAFLIAKYLILHEESFADGVALAIALFRMAFLIMLERTLRQFMKAAFQVDIPRLPALDGCIKGAALLLVFGVWLPSQFVLGVSLVLAALLIGRFFFWHPWMARRRIELAVMYFGYGAIVAELLLTAMAQMFGVVWVGSVATHVFTVGAMGVVVPAMIVRIAKGHTGRKVVFDRGDKAVLVTMLLAFVLRIVVPQGFPENYLLWLELTAACWFVAFGTLLLRLGPMLLRPRVDLREH